MLSANIFQSGSEGIIFFCQWKLKSVSPKKIPSIISFTKRFFRLWDVGYHSQYVGPVVVMISFEKNLQKKSITYSSEIVRGLQSTKYSSKMLQNLLYLMHKKTYLCTFFLLFSSYNYFYYISMSRLTRHS